MKGSELLLVFLLALISCQEVDNELVNYHQVSEGYYQGWFNYHDRDYWCLIHFENNRYEEWPSGGVMFQKSMACLTKGTYRVEGNTLVINPGTFKHEGFPGPCDVNIMLPGVYELFDTGRQDSIVFAKGKGDNRIIYHVVNRTDNND